MTEPRTAELILGVSDSHDSGVAIIREGHILAAINEERFTRVKMAAGMPRRSLAEVWRIAGVRPEDITRVALAGSSSAGTPPINNDFTDERGKASVPQQVAELIDRLPGGGAVMGSPRVNTMYRTLMRGATLRRIAAVKRELLQLGIDGPIEAYNHHDCHVASAYYTSGEPRALVISNDGFGDGQCAKIAIGDQGHLRTVSENSFINSLGVYYNYVTHFCGFPKSHHAGKTTGLAAFGDAQRTIALFRDLITWDGDQGIYVSHGHIFRNCLRDLYARLNGTSREDAAAGVQLLCEEIVTAQVRHWIATTQIGRIVLVGGVHANVKVNQHVAEQPGVERVFIFPNMGDGGLALGAAFLEWARVEPSTATPRVLPDVYLGPAFSEELVARALRAAGVAFERPPDLASAVAEALAADRVVGRFDGRMEYGPRALGNRSILYPATKPEVNAWLNRQLRRTEFMPFAPVVRVEDAPAFFVGFDERTAHTAEFMTITYNVTERCRREAPAIVHVDGTARPQVLRRSTNPAYYAIVDAYHQRTGLSVLVNTSFNMHEEPIVCTPADAVEAFFQSALDVLAIGPFLVRNSPKG
jgi:carbamoyltransferase